MSHTYTARSREYTHYCNSGCGRKVRREGEQCSRCSVLTVMSCCLICEQPSLAHVEEDKGMQNFDGTFAKVCPRKWRSA